MSAWSFIRFPPTDPSTCRAAERSDFGEEAADFGFRVCIARDGAPAAKRARRTIQYMKLPAACRCLFAIAAFTSSLLATPSTQIWSPSTDVQPYKVWHLGLDSYTRTTSKGAVTNNVYDAGLTVGVLPYEKVQLETGIDYLETGTNSAADHSPIYFNAKLGTPEGSLGSGSPAFAVGGYNFGTKTGVTTQNIAYGLLAKTLPKTSSLPSLGRISLGYYRGSKRVLVDENGYAAEDGMILTWDRTMSEISDKLWLAVDYASGRSANGALNFGFAWSFAKNTSVIFAYDIYNNKKTGGKDTVTIQLDINFP
ncbi:MAG TPA: hypothetical protein VHD62_08890 [Opitutaceae bacterium]|nr:hypothetical protein [Opitutaceae bacterium]